MTDQLSLFETKLHEYFFLIPPDQRTKQEVTFLKGIANNLINLSEENLWSVPHLSLFKCMVGYSIDDLIIRKTAKALKNIHSFKIKLDGLEVFTHKSSKKTLVLKIKNPDPINTINKSLTDEFYFRPHTLLPHITIAKSINQSDFGKLSYSLNKFDYKGEFLCNKIIILKKVIGENKRYSVLHEAALN